VIVFVHGILGGPVSTWTNDHTQSYWPNLLAQDADFKDTDVYVLSYDSPFLSSSYTLDDLIENARLKLDNAEIFSKHAHVVFLCHSMGGLIVRGLLKRYDDNRRKVPLIYFLSTPTAGSHIANLGMLISSNPQMKALGPMPKNSDSMLNSLQHDWRALNNRPLSKCAFEVRDTYGVRVVDQTSASALCDGPLDPINEDHIGIAKPPDRQADSYMAFRAAFVKRPAEQLNSNGVSISSETIEGHVDTLRKVDVDCGETKQADLTEIDPPITLESGRLIKDAISSLQQTSNLKFGEVVPHGVKSNKAVLSYRLEGLDKSASGRCAGKGLGIIVIAFVLTQPSSMALPAGFQVITSADRSLLTLSRPGAVRIDDVSKVDSIDIRSSMTRWTLRGKIGEQTAGYEAMMHVEGTT
jgi:hypothetical protein